MTIVVMTKRDLFFVLILSFSLLNSCYKSATFPPGEWIDLSHDFSEDTIYWPTSETFKSQTVFMGMTDKGFYYTAKNYSAAEHGGTHVDAPVHFSKGKKTVDEIPINNLVGPGIVIDVSEESLATPDYQVGIEDFQNWESKFGRIPDNSIVLINTGYSSYWPNKKKYLGTDVRGEAGVKELHFPGLHPDAARWLVNYRKIIAIGLDTASIDYGQSQLFESHVILLENNIPAFENVTNIDKLPPKGSLVIALPMKIKGGSGAPLRIIAFMPYKK